MSASCSGGGRNAAGHASAAGPAVSPANDAPAEACCEWALHLSPLPQHAAASGPVCAGCAGERCQARCPDCTAAQRAVHGRLP